MVAVGGVVEEGEGFGGGVGEAPARVVLEAEVGAVAEREGAVCAAELLQDGAVGAGNFVDRAGVAGGDQVVAVGVLVD